MTSGPYKSSLLRFVVSQYRNGLARHHRAVRETRSRAVFGTAMALAPVYAVIRSSRQVGRNIRQLIGKNTLFAMSPKVMQILDFSDFQALPDALDVMDGTSVQAKMGPEFPIAQMMALVGQCLSFRQVRQLSTDQLSQVLASGLDERKDKDHAPTGQVSTDTVRPVTLRLAKGWQQFRQLLNGKQSGIAEAGRITGVASDVETRSLVLVRGHTTVWDGLSPAQQQRLQKAIALLLGEVVCQAVDGFNERCVPAAGTDITYMGSTQNFAVTELVTAEFSRAVTQVSKTLLSVQSRGIVRPMRSFWVEVLRMINHLQHQSGADAVARLKSGWAKFSGASPIRKLFSTPCYEAKGGAIAAQLPPSIVSFKAFGGTTAAGIPRLSASVDSYLEADVIAIDYVEHPLETVLKWLDRILLWVENRWRAFRIWVCG